MISAVILTKNEEAIIEDCIKAVSWCDEIILLDDKSTDNTVLLAKELGAKALVHQLTDFASQRNYALEHTMGDWIFFVDADEKVSDALRKEIQNVLANNDIKGYFLRRQDTMWGKALKYGETANIKLLRLAKKDAGAWQGKVHETWHVTGKTAELSNPLLHYPHQSIAEFLFKINRYSDIRARELYVEGVKANALLIILYPQAKFVLNYVIKLGFLDGVAGFIHALMMSMHSFLVRGKLWLLWQKKSTS